MAKIIYFSIILKLDMNIRDYYHCGNIGIFDSSCVGIEHTHIYTCDKSPEGKHVITYHR